MPNVPTITEADILAKVLGRKRSKLAPQAALSILEMRFDKESTRRIRRLLQKNNKGTITPAERVTLERYLRVGQLLDLLQANAKLSLQKRPSKP
jgi:hypothetical protein